MSTRSRAAGIGALGLALTLAASLVHGTSMEIRNLADLIGLAEHIQAGTVVRVVDGFDARGVPYTEVTLHVDEALKGQAGDTYTFRQFGLTAPRRDASGRLNANVSPDGWPRFHAGEDVLVFLYRSARLTGLRTTVGLLQGKFDKVDGAYRNAIGNRNLFHEMSVSSGLLTEKQRTLLQGDGPVPAEELLDLVRRAVRERWVETGRMKHELR